MRVCAYARAAFVTYFFFLPKRKRRQKIRARERSVFRYFFFFFFFFFFFVFQNHNKARERAAKDERNTSAGCSVGERVRRVDRDEIETERVLDGYLRSVATGCFRRRRRRRKRRRKRSSFSDTIGGIRSREREVRGKSHTGRRVRAEKICRRDGVPIRDDRDDTRGRESILRA